MVGDVEEVEEKVEEGGCSLVVKEIDEAVREAEDERLDEDK